MKVLYITNNLLDNNGGGNIATSAFVNAFTEISSYCLLIYPDKGQKIADYINERTVLHCFADDKYKIGKFIDICFGRINRYKNVIIPEIDFFQPDIIVFDGSRSSSGVISRVKSLGKRIITIHHNYEMQYYKGTKPSFLWRIPFMYSMERAERLAVQLSDLNLTLTDQDKELLQLHYDPDNNANIEKWGCFESLPSHRFNEGKDDVQFYIDDRQNKEELEFIITGSLNTHQSESSLIRFINKMYHILTKRLPNSRLIIAGRNPSGNLKNVCKKYPAITLLPNPENIQEIVNQADVYICPTNIGGGLKLRIMDGLKAGLPVLAHEISARGYDEFQKAGFLFTYNDQLSFEYSLERLLSENIRKGFSKHEIQRLYHSSFSYESGVNRIKNYLVQYNLQ